MKFVKLFLSLALAGFTCAQAQTALDLNAGLRMEEGAGQNEYVVKWWGILDRAYALQTSTDLENWTFVNQAFVGQGAIITGVGTTLQNGGDRVFWKLQYSDTALANPLQWDPDLDRIGLQDELDHFTNPFENFDDDNDGLPDDWEWFYSGSHSLNEYSDYDGDFILDGFEWQYDLNPAGEDPIPSISFSPSATPVYEGGSIEISIESDPYIGHIYYTIDGSMPTIDSLRFHPSAPIITGDNGQLTVKARVILPDGREGSTISATYKFRPMANPQEIIYGWRPATGQFEYRLASQYASLAPSVNGATYSHGYLKVGMGWIQNGEFVPDLSQGSQPLYYGMVSYKDGAENKKFFGYSTSNKSFWATPNALFWPTLYVHDWPRNYQPVGQGWVYSHDKIEPDMQSAGQVVRVVQNFYYMPTDPVSVSEVRWALTTDSVDAAGGTNFIYRIGNGWITGPESMNPDTSQSSSTVYYGVVAGHSGLRTIYTDNGAIFPPQSTDHIELSVGWPSGLNGMVPDKSQTAQTIYYGEKDYVSAVSNERVVALSPADINQYYYLQTYEDVDLSIGWTTSIETYEVDYTKEPKTVYLGTEKVGPGNLPHIEFHAYNASELSESNPSSLGVGWIENNYFIPYTDDNDGLTYSQEIDLGTDPWSADSDGDGIDDGTEVANNTNPNKPDTDDDGENDDVDIDPNDPTNGQDDLVPPGQPIIEIDHVTIRRSKPGFVPFMTDDPPSNRYLRKVYEQSFTQTGEGSAPESSLSVKEISTVNPLTGEVTTQTTGKTSTRGSAGTVASPTERSGTTEISSYDDEPNTKDDATGDLHVTEELSQVYTTPAFVQDTLANQEPWPDTYNSRLFSAYYHIINDDLTVIYRKIRYRFKWDDIPENHQEKTINWTVLFLPDDLELPLVTAGYSWTGTALEHEGTPIVPNREGSWKLLDMRVEWESLHPDNPVQNDWEYPQAYTEYTDLDLGYLNGHRYFAGAKDHTGTAMRNIINVKVSTNDSRLFGEKVVLKAFDVDDADTDADADPNGGAGNDNDTTTLAAGKFVSNLSDTITLELDVNGNAETQFRLRSAPGSNYRIAAVLEESKGKFDKLQVDDPSEGFFVTSDNEPVADFTGGALSDMLTVWRKLHVEVDSMQMWNGDKPEPDRTTAIGLQWQPNHPLIFKSRLILTDDLVDNNSTPFVYDDDFYGQGTIISGAIQFDVDANTRTTIDIVNPGLSVAPSATELNAFIGQEFEVFDDDDMGLTSNPLSRPGTINDHVKAKFISSFIEVEQLPLQYDLIPFKLYADYLNPASTIDDYQDFGGENESWYWYQYIVVAYQPSKDLLANDQDGDPVGENLLAGVNIGGSAAYNDYVVVFVESVRDSLDATRTVSNFPELVDSLINDVVSHEIGHSPGNHGGDDDHGELGLMSASLTQSRGKDFTGKSRRRFRTVTDW